MRMIPQIIKWLYAIGILALLLTGCAPTARMGLSGPGAPFPEQPRQVALMLPLHGRYGASGQAIRNGFLAAYYQAKQSNPYVPKVRIIDTSRGGNITQLYGDAVAGGAQIVIGPLTKQNVQNINELRSPSVPVLTLNATENLPVSNQVYQFALSPEEEAQQVAYKAWSDGRRRVIVIAPNSSLSQRVARAFSISWNHLGGTIVDTLNFKTTRELAPQIRNRLGIDAGEKRHTRLERIFGERIRHVPRRRQDIDMIFLIGSPSEASQIAPLLKFYFAGDIPTYATSAIYNGYPNGNVDRDIEGILFCDMPFVLDNPMPLSPNLQAIRQNVMTLWPRSFHRNVRLTAMGVDAYLLMVNLNRLRQSPNITLPGATGTLSLTADRKIARQLIWVRMQHGHLTP